MPITRVIITTPILKSTPLFYYVLDPLITLEEATKLQFLFLKRDELLELFITSFNIPD